MPARVTRASKATREKIIKAASRAFARNGYDGASIRTIVAAADVNQAAINYHFGSKDGLYRAVLQAALLAALVRKETEGRKDAESRKDGEGQAKPEAAAAPKPAKPVQAAQARRSQKPEQAATSEPQPRASEPVAIQPPLAAANAAPKPVVQGPMPLLGRDGFATTPPSGGEEERPLLARLRQAPSWLAPENERVFGNVPRPPMPVGEFLPSAM